MFYVLDDKAMSFVRLLIVIDTYFVHLLSDLKLVC